MNIGYCCLDFECTEMSQQLLTPGRGRRWQVSSVAVVNLMAGPMSFWIVCDTEAATRLPKSGPRGAASTGGA